MKACDLRPIFYAVTDTKARALSIGAGRRDCECGQLSAVRPVRRRLFCSAISIATICAWSATTVAQELVPRAYWPAPKGTDLLIVGYQRSAGDVVTDPTLPLTGVDSKINYAQVTYQRTLSLFDRTTNVQVSLPYTWGSTEGTFMGQPARRDLSAMADMRALLSVNLLGAPSMDVAEFQALRKIPRTLVGASIQIQAPTGAYEPDKLINTGTNRWAAKPAVGVIWPMFPTWLLEADIGAWFFTDNDEFLGNTREQDPILSGEVHLVKRIKPGFWASLDVNYYRGGRTTVGGVLNADLQRNSRLGGTIVYPVRKRNAIRASYNTGLVTSSGGDYRNLSLSYVFIW